MKNLLLLKRSPLYHWYDAMLSELMLVDWYNEEILIDLDLKNVFQQINVRDGSTYLVERKEVMEYELCVHSK
jgi:hypothetical protein